MWIVMSVEALLRKKARVRKQEKRHYAKSSATLAGQISRTKTAKHYRDGRGVRVKVMMKWGIIPNLLHEWEFDIFES